MQSDKKRERKRNFLPAKVGIFGSFLFCVYFTILFLSYSLEASPTCNYWVCWYLKLLLKADSGTKAFLLAFALDPFYCIMSPMLVFYGAPSIRRKIRRWNRVYITSNSVLIIQGLFLIYIYNISKYDFFALFCFYNIVWYHKNTVPLSVSYNI